MRSKSVGSYILLNKLGAGTFAKVYLGIHRDSNKKVAIKVLKKSTVKSKSSLQKIKREVAIHRLLKHPNVISLYDVYESKNSIYIILEYVPNGELFNYIVKRGRIPPNETLKFFQQTVYALEYCNLLNISHRDVKPENILLDSHYNIKLTDFGMARAMQESYYLHTSCGSPHYAAPEILSEKEYDGRKCVIWSLGVMLFAMLYGELPFDRPNYKELAEVICLGKYKMPSSASSVERDIIRRMLTVNPDERITLSEIKKHPYFTQNFPSSYSPPELPPLFSLEEPLDLDSVDSKIVNHLVNLGGSTKAYKKKVLQDLTSYGPNLIKSYYILYTQRTEDFKMKKELKRRRRGSLSYHFSQDKNSSSLGTELPRAMLDDPAPPTKPTFATRDRRSLSTLNTKIDTFQIRNELKKSRNRFDRMSLSPRVGFNISDDAISSSVIDEDWFGVSDSTGLTSGAESETELRFERIIAKIEAPLLDVAAAIQKVLRRRSSKYRWVYPNATTFSVTKRMDDGEEDVKIKIKIRQKFRKGDKKISKRTALNAYSGWKIKRRWERDLLHAYDDEAIMIINKTSKPSSQKAKFWNQMEFIWVEGDPGEFYDVAMRLIRKIKSRFP